MSNGNSIVVFTEIIHKVVPGLVVSIKRTGNLLGIFKLLLTSVPLQSEQFLTTIVLCSSCYKKNYESLITCRVLSVS